MERRNEARAVSHALLPLLAVLAASPLASAQEPDGTRRLQVLLAAGEGDAEGAERERCLITELRLLLDAVEVVAMPVADTGFGAMPPAEQAARAAAGAVEAGAEAAVWLAEVTGPVLEVRLVRRGGSDVLSREVGIDAAPSPEALLAAAVWELLQVGQPAPRRPGGDPGQPAAQVRDGERIAAARGPEPDAGEERRGSPVVWGVAAALESAGGIDSRLPSGLLGGGAAVTLEAAGGLLVAAGIAGLADAGSAGSGGMSLAVRIEPRLEVGPAWYAGFLRVAPFLRLAAPCSSYRMVLEGQEDFGVWLWNGRFDLGLSLAFRAARWLRIFAAGSVGAGLVQDSFEMESGREIVRGSLFEWGASVGVVLLP